MTTLIIDTLKLDALITSARLSGRINMLVELRDWLDGKIADAERVNDQLRGNLQDTNTRGSASGTAE